MIQGSNFNSRLRLDESEEKSMLRKMIAKVRCRSKYKYGGTRCTRKHLHRGKHWGEWRIDGLGAWRTLWK